MNQKGIDFQSKLKSLLHYLEFGFAFVAGIGSLYYLVINVISLAGQDWTVNETYLHFLNVLLIVIIGIEISRILITHNLLAVIEVVGFVMARKLILPETTPIEILIVTAAFAILIYTRALFMKSYSRNMNFSEQVD